MLLGSGQNFAARFAGRDAGPQQIHDAFIRLATAGLIVLFGVQSVINMAVNLNLMPAKGMTLPFVSYGGSSLISLAYGMGMLIALTRERPRGHLSADMPLVPRTA